MNGTINKYDRSHGDKDSFPKLAYSFTRGVNLNHYLTRDHSKDNWCITKNTNLEGWGRNMTHYSGCHSHLRSARITIDDTKECNWLLKGGVICGYDQRTWIGQQIQSLKVRHVTHSQLDMVQFMYTRGWSILPH